jgi:hypothetical protein
MHALGLGALSPFSQLARAGDNQDVYEWKPPPVGLRWSTQGRSEYSSGKIHHTLDEFEIRAVEGDLVTYRRIDSDLTDGSVRDFEYISWRMWEEKSSRAFESDRVQERSKFNPDGLTGFWPWRIGSNFRHQEGKKHDYTYNIESFEDLNSAGFRGRCARIVATGINGGYPVLDSSLYAAETGIRVQRYLKASWDSAGWGSREVVTVVAEEHLSSWSMP